MRLRSCGLTFLAAAAPAAQLCAAEPTTDLPDGVFTLGTVTVTARRVADGAPPALVIPGADMERFDFRRLDDVLDSQPGLTMTPGARGSARAENRVYLRGFDGLQTPFLIDGIPFYVSWDGEPTDLGRFTTFDLAAIEVSKGYIPITTGPGALGGAINLVTRRPTAAFESDFGAGVDVDNDSRSSGYRAHANVGGRWGNWYAQFGWSALETDDWRLSDDFAPAGTPVAAPLQGNLQPAGTRLRSRAEDRKVSLKLGYAPNETDEYAFAFYDQAADKQVPPYAGPPNANQRFNYFDWPQWDKRGYYFLSNTALTERAWLRTRLYYDIFRNSLDSYDNITYTTQNTPRAFSSKYDDHSIGGSVVVGFAVGPGELTFAGHARQDDHEDIQIAPVRSPSAPATLKFEDYTWSVGSEYRWPLADTLNAVVGVSHDTREAKQAQDQNRGGASFALGEQSATNAQAGLTWRLSESTELHASVGRRSRFPSQFERYSYRLGSAIPNPDLALERSTHYEIGYSGRLAPTLSIDGAVFVSNLDDLIQPVTISPGVIQNQNVGRARYSGVEAAVKWSPLAALSLGANYTWLDRESRSTPRRILFGTPEHAAFVYASWRAFERLELVPSINYASERNTSDVASARGEPVSGFTVANLRAICDITARYSVEASARNLFDKNYQLDYGYPREGRAFSLMLRGRFQ